MSRNSSQRLKVTYCYGWKERNLERTQVLLQVVLQLNTQKICFFLLSSSLSSVFFTFFENLLDFGMWHLLLVEWSRAWYISNMYFTVVDLSTYHFELPSNSLYMVPNSASDSLGATTSRVIGVIYCIVIDHNMYSVSASKTYRPVT